MPAVIRALGDLRPRIGRGVFLAETCAVVADVELGDDCSIWYGAVLRGDVMPIRVGPRTNLQDGAIVHVTAGKFSTSIGADCTIGHGAILHACTIEDHCLVGMGATVLDGAVIGTGSFIGAGALVTPGTIIPPGSLVLGSPARVKRAVNAKEREQIESGAMHYIELARRYLASSGETSVP